MNLKSALHRRCVALVAGVVGGAWPTRWPAGRERRTAAPRSIVLKPPAAPSRPTGPTGSRRASQPAELEGRACVTDVVRTVVVPGSTPARRPRRRRRPAPATRPRSGPTVGTNDDEPATVATSEADDHGDDDDDDDDTRGDDDSHTGTHTGTARPARARPDPHPQPRLTWAQAAQHRQRHLDAGPAAGAAAPKVSDRRTRRRTPGDVEPEPVDPAGPGGAAEPARASSSTTRCTAAARAGEQPDREAGGSGVWAKTLSTRTSTRSARSSAATGTLSARSGSSRRDRPALVLGQGPPERDRSRDHLGGVAGLAGDRVRTGRRASCTIASMLRCSTPMCSPSRATELGVLRPPRRPAAAP